MKQKNRKTLQYNLNERKEEEEIKNISRVKKDRNQ